MSKSRVILGERNVQNATVSHWLIVTLGVCTSASVCVCASEAGQVGVLPVCLPSLYVVIKKRPRADAEEGVGPENEGRGSLHM